MKQRQLHSEVLDAAVEVEAFFSAEKQQSFKTKVLQAVTSQSPRPMDPTLRLEVHKLETMVQCLTQHPRGTPDTPPNSWQRNWTPPECWLCGAQGHIQCYCPKRFEHRPRTSSSRSLQPPKERPGNETMSSSRFGAQQTPHTKAHLRFSQNRCCGHWQRSPVCQWGREGDTSLVCSGLRSKHHHHSDPVVGGHVSQSSINTKPA